MRIGVIAALLGVSIPAFAEPLRSRFELGGFFGVDHFGDEIGLGGSPAPEQRPQTAPTFGGRLTYIPLSVGGDIHLDLGLEVDASFTASWTGYGFDGPRMSYFAPVIGYHGNLLLRLGGGWFQPHVTVGGGGETVLSDSPFMAKETDPVFLWGVGASFQMGDRWQMRFDGRQGLIEARDGGTTQTYEAHVSIGARLGVRARPTPITEVEIVTRPLPQPPPERDTDSDGIPDHLDRCPNQPELVNGIEDEDGCPETDRDGDGIVDVVDKCPDRAEDFDGFEDEDGCPDDDNDNDGIPDVHDRCPNEPETVNGIADEDGCPDVVPPEITTAFAEAGRVKFERGRAPLSKAAKAALDKAVVVALSNQRLKITLTVHPEAATQAAIDLATKRLAVVKFYLTEQGVAMSNLTTLVGAPATDTKAPLVVLTITQ